VPRSGERQASWTLGLLGLLAVVALAPGCKEKVQMRVANDKPNDLRIELSLPGGGVPTLDRVRVLALPADSVLWEASGPAAQIEELSYGDAPADFDERSPAIALAAGGQVLVKVSGDGVRGELAVRVKED
jgi:hypothetical protein